MYNKHKRMIKHKVSSCRGGCKFDIAIACFNFGKNERMGYEVKKVSLCLVLAMLVSLLQGVCLPAFAHEEAPAFSLENQFNTEIGNGFIATPAGPFVVADGKAVPGDEGQHSMVSAGRISGCGYYTMEFDLSAAHNGNPGSGMFVSLRSGVEATNATDARYIWLYFQDQGVGVINTWYGADVVTMPEALSFKTGERHVKIIDDVIKNEIWVYVEDTLVISIKLTDNADGVNFDVAIKDELAGSTYNWQKPKECVLTDNFLAFQAWSYQCSQASLDNLSVLAYAEAYEKPEKDAILNNFDSGEIGEGFSEMAGEGSFVVENGKAVTGSAELGRHSIMATTRLSGYGYYTVEMDLKSPHSGQNASGTYLALRSGLESTNASNPAVMWLMFSNNQIGLVRDWFVVDTVTLGDVDFGAGAQHVKVLDDLANNKITVWVNDVKVMTLKISETGGENYNIAVKNELTGAVSQQQKPQSLMAKDNMFAFQIWSYLCPGTEIDNIAIRGYHETLPPDEAPTPDDPDVVTVENNFNSGTIGDGWGSIGGMEGDFVVKNGKAVTDSAEPTRHSLVSSAAMGKRGYVVTQFDVAAPPSGQVASGVFVALRCPDRKAVAASAEFLWLMFSGNQAAVVNTWYQTNSVTIPVSFADGEKTVKIVDNQVDDVISVSVNGQKVMTLTLTESEDTQNINIAIKDEIGGAAYHQTKPAANVVKENYTAFQCWEYLCPGAVLDNISVTGYKNPMAPESGRLMNSLQIAGRELGEALTGSGSAEAPYEAQIQIGKKQLGALPVAVSCLKQTEAFYTLSAQETLPDYAEKLEGGSVTVDAGGMGYLYLLAKRGDVEEHYKITINSVADFATNGFESFAYGGAKAVLDNTSVNSAGRVQITIPVLQNENGRQISFSLVDKSGEYAYKMTIDGAPYQEGEAVLLNDNSILRLWAQKDGAVVVPEMEYVVRFKAITQKPSITAFSLKEAPNAAGEIKNGTITIKLAESMRGKGPFTPVFALASQAGGAAAYVGAEAQTSGVSKQAFDGPVTYRVTDDSGEETEYKVSITYQAPKEPDRAESGKGTSNANSGKGIVDQIGFAAPDSGLEQAPGFADIDGCWAKNEITILSQKGILSGRDASHFAPDDAISREEFVKVVLLAFGLYDENAKEAGFTDVAPGDWYASYVASAVACGVINGISETEFGAGQNITRQDMAVILLRAAQAAGKSFEKTQEALAFSDAADISPYAAESVLTLYAAGVIGGFGDGTYRPGQAATRAQVARLVCVAMGWA